MRVLFGNFENTVDRLQKLAYVQYECVRLAVEAARRKQPFCRGVLFWMLNDCWPATSWSLIDYYARPKAGYYGLRHAARPVHCSFRREGPRVEAWASNFTSRPATRNVRVTFESWDGNSTPVASQAATIPAGGSCLLTHFDPTTIPHFESGVFYALTDGFADESGWYFHGMPHQMKPPPATLEVTQVDRSENRITVDLRADSYARVVTFRGPVVADDCYFDLRAGETKRVSLVLENAGEPMPIAIESWNALPGSLRLRPPGDQGN